jgi:predicted component of type VI protein secretion system
MVMHRPNNGERRPSPDKAPLDPTAATTSDTLSLQRRRARARVEALERHLRIARWADREMPLAEFYRAPGWPHGRYCLIAEGVPA